MNIEKWLKYFTVFWKNYDIDGVLSLFTDDVEYWETPFFKIKDKNKLKKEWEYIKVQGNIKLDYEVFSGFNNIYTIKFGLSYINLENNENSNFKGIYLIKLNSENKCSYFFQCGENN